MSKDKEDYIHIVENATDIPIFYQPWWLDALAQGKQWDAVIARDKNDNITGIWSFFIQKKWGLKLSLSPAFTPFLGPWLFYPSNQLKQSKKLSFENKTLKKLSIEIRKHDLTYLSQYTNPILHNGTALQFEGFQERLFYRSIIHNIKDYKAVRSRFKYNKKYAIKKFHKTGKIIESESIQELQTLMQQSFKRRNSNIGTHHTLLSNLHEQLSKKQLSKIYYAINEQQKIIAGVYVVLDNQMAYLLSTGFNAKNSEAVTALIDYAIQASSKKANSFDFCGSMIPGISSFFQDFGGELHRYSMLKYFSNPVIETLYTLSQMRNKFK